MPVQGAVKLLFTFRHGGQQCSKNACSPAKGAVTQRAAEPPATRHVHGCVSGKNDLCGSEPLGSQDWLPPRHALASADQRVTRHPALEVGTVQREGGDSRDRQPSRRPGGGSCGRRRLWAPSRNPQDCTRAQRPGSPAAFPSCTAFTPFSICLPDSKLRGAELWPPACQQGPGQCPELRMRSVMLPNTRRWTVLWMLSGRGQVLSSSPWPLACKPGFLPEASRL